MSTLRRFYSRTSVHGLADLGAAGAKGRLFWAIALLGFATACIYQMVKLSVNYYNEEVGTQTQAVMPTTIPGAVVCPVDWMDLTPGRGETSETLLRRRRYLNGYLPMFMSDYLLSIKHDAKLSVLVTRNESDRFFAESNGVGSFMLSQVKDVGVGPEDSEAHETIILPQNSELAMEPFISYHGPCLTYYTNETMNNLQVQLGGSVLRMSVPERNMAENTSSFIFSVASSIDPKPLVLPKLEILEYGYEYAVKFSPLLIRRKNRWPAPCKSWTRSDQFACTVRHGNQFCLQDEGNDEMRGDNPGGSGGTWNQEHHGDSADMPPPGRPPPPPRDGYTHGSSGGMPHQEPNGDSADGPPPGRPPPPGGDTRGGTGAIRPDDANRKCVTYVPPTPFYSQEATGKFCNVFNLAHIGHIGGLCIMQTMSLYQEDGWAEVCPGPCVDESYQFTYQRLRSTDSKNSVVIKMQAESRGGIVITEYFKTNAETLLSGLGGTMGLWLGASFVSLIQAAYLLWCRADTEITMRSEALN